MLISTTAELMKFVEVSVDLDIVSLTPSIKKAEKRFIIPVLGRAFYNEVSQYGINEVRTSLQAELVEYINCVIGPMAMWYYTQVGGVSVDNSGIYKPKNENRWNLGEGEQARLTNHFLNSGLDALEDLINFLNDHLSDFETYAISDEREESFNTLVPTATIVQKVFTMLHPQVTFRALKESIRFVENRVKGFMQEFYNHAVSSNALTLNEKSMRDVAQKAVIYMATARALLTRTVQQTNDGVDVLMGDRPQISVPENARIEAAARVYENSGEAELANLIALMNANPPTGYVAPIVTAFADRKKCGDDSRIAFL